MKNNKGFTLVELLVVMVVMGVIMGMSWPVISKIQDNNEISKYKKYGEALVSAAKIYVDSYEEDLFMYEDDLTEEQKEKGQCVYITYNDLADHLLIKDYAMNGVTCNSESTFVAVNRQNGNYRYKYFLGCGYAKPNGAQLKNGSGDIFYTLPTENHENVKDPATCSNSVVESDPPIISSLEITSTQEYNSYDPKVTIFASDTDTAQSDLRVCISESSDECSASQYSKYGGKSLYSKKITLSNKNYDGGVRTIFVHVKDSHGNVAVVSGQYTVYKTCSEKTKKNIETFACNKTCGGGEKITKYDTYDKYFDSICETGATESEPCNLQSCCKKVRKVCEGEWHDIDPKACDHACQGETKVRWRTCKEVSVDDGTLCKAPYETTERVPCESTDTCVYAATYILEVEGGTYQCNPSSQSWTGERHCLIRRDENANYVWINTGRAGGLSCNWTRYIVDNYTGEVYCNYQTMQSSVACRNIYSNNATLKFTCVMSNGSHTPYLYITVIGPDEVEPEWE